jgi:hypothetical protein
MAQINANLANYETQESFSPLPPGEYKATVMDSEIKQGGKGPYINWTFKISGHPNKVWDIMSLGNDISMQRLKTLAVACGHKNPNYIADTEELHGKYFIVKLKIEIDETGQYAPKNKVAGFKCVEKPGGNGGSIPADVPPAHIAASAVASAPAKPKMPWD